MLMLDEAECVGCGQCHLICPEEAITAWGLAVIDRDKCTECLECINICPAGAAKLNKDSVWIDKDICIHCMCCHEACRFQAIKIKMRLMGKIIQASYSLYRILNLLTSR